MGMIDCYAMDIYCDHPDHWPIGGTGPAQITGRSRTDCLTQARKSGWIIKKVAKPIEGDVGLGNCVCPRCADGHFQVGFQDWIHVGRGNRRPVLKPEGELK